MNFVKKFVTILVLCVLALTVFACAPTSAPVDASTISVNESTRLVNVESDNAFSYDYDDGVVVSNSVYTLDVTLYDEVTNHQETNASGSGSLYGSYGYASYRMWQEGKGLLPVTVNSITPDYPYVSAGDSIVVKTSDLKVMALPSGSSIIIICNDDVEALSPLFNGQDLTTNRVTHELDDCRMTSPVYSE